MSYRLIKASEIRQLQEQGCTAGDWLRILVREGFNTDSIHDCRFEGSNRLGVFSGTIEVEKGIPKKCGLYSSYIRDCTISDHVYISGVKSLANYLIEKEVVIENAGSLVVRGETAFGNGTVIDVLNEGGGRELPVFDGLSSQVAYFAVLYRHDREFTDKLLGMIRQYCHSKLSNRGRIGRGAKILDTLMIRNVTIGDFSTISGASLLEEGTIESSEEDPSFIGEGVIAKKFIVLSGSRIDGCAIVQNSFIGQGVMMGKQFSSENSVFFANCEAFHGEACSLFAGPYTVTHHKSTLMIASLCSFFNAGSGTNQSNHMYKLGPVHQGIFERGSKTGSFAYLILPSVVGAFTVVMGKHYVNFDTSDFPFSYITEEKGKSELTPAMNIFTVGTRRDSEKWPLRDRRKNLVKTDLIHFELFSPYIVLRMLNGIRILGELAEKTPRTQDYVNYKGINIHRLLLKATRKYYEMGLKVYIGQEVVKRLKWMPLGVTLDEIRKQLKTSNGEGKGRWIEVSGMFAPAGLIDNLISSVKSGHIDTVSKFQESLINIFNGYDLYSWEWCADLIEKQTGMKPDNITADILNQIISDWKINVQKLNNMILKDAEKEFSVSSRLGFGIDGDESARDGDFFAVRGTYEGNKFVVSLQEEIRKTGETADRLCTIFEKMIREG